jgi:K+-sensing histidine kinase KdpD
LTHAHGGSVRAENRDEGGARFVVRIPTSTAHRPLHRATS